LPETTRLPVKYVFPAGPAKMFDDTTRFAMLAAYETLMLEVTTFVVCRAFEAYMFPAT
jgi:hypothetical protein